MATRGVCQLYRTVIGVVCWSSCAKVREFRPREYRKSRSNKTQDTRSVGSGNISERLLALLLWSLGPRDVDSHAGHMFVGNGYGAVPTRRRESCWMLQYDGKMGEFESCGTVCEVLKATISAP